MFRRNKNKEMIRKLEEKNVLLSKNVETLNNEIKTRDEIISKITREKTRLNTKIQKLEASINQEEIKTEKEQKNKKTPKKTSKTTKKAK